VIIHLKNIDGVFTNGDQNDIPENFATTLQNLKPTNGKLEKTFGFGDIWGVDVLDIIETDYWVDTGNVWDDGQWWLDTSDTMDKALDESIVNVVVFFNSNATAGSGGGSGDGFIYIALAISSTTGTVTTYYWTGADWENITNLIENTPDTFYQIYGKNPIIQENEIIRFLPGGQKYAGTGSAIHQPSGMWLGYIDRDYFDGLYEEGTDYTGGFYLYNNYPTRPDITSNGLSAVATVTAGGTWMAADGSRYYKIAYKYDGINLSLLSEEIKVTYTDTTYLQLLLTIPTSSFNLRCTSLEVYRSETGNIGDTVGSIDGSYELIQSIDLTRDPDSVDLLTGVSALSGSRYIYLADCDTIDHLGQSNWYININGTSSTQKIFLTPSTINTEYEGVGWTLYYNFTTMESQGDVCYAGDQYVILEDTEAEFQEDVLAGSLITIDHLGTKYNRVIESNYGRAIKMASVISTLTGSSAKPDWQILQAKNGLYYFDESGSNILLYFYDTEITEGAAYPLLNEPAIAVNSEVALYYRGRLFQFGHTVLDPGASGENEEHDDWLMYSELDQPDVQPVSNAIRISDATGGKGTGIATSFGSLVLLKENSVHKLTISDPSDATTWRLTESVFNRGCVAKDGYIQVGHKVYFSATDGIYELDVNFEAAADETPLIQNRISEAINDTYLALNDISEKPFITCGYDKIYTEIIWRLTSSSIWAFNILTKQWREIDTAKTCDIFAYDQYDDLMIFNESDDTLYTINDSIAGESVGCCVATKFFNISGGEGQRKGYVRSCTIRYKSAVALLVRTYLDDSSTMSVGDEKAPALTQANWDTVAGWDLSGSTLNHSSDGTGTISPLTSLAPIVSDIYKVVITLSACTVGSCTYTLGGTSGTTLSSATTYTDYIIASTTGDLIFTPSSASARFIISAVSVKRVVGRSLPIASSISTVKFAVRARCNTFKIEICDLTSSTSDTEIYDIKLEVDS